MPTVRSTKSSPDLVSPDLNDPHPVQGSVLEEPSYDGPEECKTYFKFHRVLGYGKDGPVFHLIRQGTIKTGESPKNCLANGQFHLSLDTKDMKNVRGWPSKDVVLKMAAKQRILQSETGPRHAATERDIGEAFLNPEVNTCPFVIKFLGSFQTSQKICHLSELCEGGDLYNLMDIRRGFNERDTFFYLAECLSAICYLHKKCICYSDLKPENICIMRDGHIKLIDFGLSKPVRPGQTRDSFVGTDEYMAPEVYRHEPHSFPADIWSFGALSYELFYSKLAVPFRNKDRGYEEIRFPPRKGKENPSPNFIYMMHMSMFPDQKKRPNAKELMSLNFFTERIRDWEDVPKKLLIPPYVPSLDGPVGVERSRNHQRVKKEDIMDRFKDRIDDDTNYFYFWGFKDRGAKILYPGCDEPLVEEENETLSKIPSEELQNILPVQRAARRETLEDSDDDEEGIIHFVARPQI